jgi:NAD(P)-dependent dehydrogenase (short-subunit alcohol dehydrogenase family)
MFMELAGKVVLITGGTSGIGLSTAIHLLRKGAKVIVSSRNPRPDALASLEKEAFKGKSQFHFLQADVSSKENCKSLVQEGLSKFGHIDVLIHAAGAGVPGDLFTVTEAAWAAAFDTHVHAVFHLCRAIAPGMRERGEGAVILISSVAGLRGVPGIIAYGTVKGVLPQFARMLARDLAESNIRVNCVSPGVIRTPFHDKMTLAQKANNIENRIPLHREGTPTDVADAIVMLCENEFITGENIVVDGGMTMRIV